MRDGIEKINDYYMTEFGRLPTIFEIVAWREAQAADADSPRSEQA